jgi:hypothetical protein
LLWWWLARSATNVPITSYLYVKARLLLLLLLLLGQWQALMLLLLLLTVAAGVAAAASTCATAGGGAALTALFYCYCNMCSTVLPKVTTSSSSMAGSNFQTCSHLALPAVLMRAACSCCSCCGKGICCVPC